MTKPEPTITWISANEIIERQTIELERLYHSSRPKPNNRRMGFKGEPPKKRDLTNPDDWEERN